MPSECIEFPVVRGRIHASESGFADIGQAWTELIVQDPEQAKDDVTCAGGVTHYFNRFQTRLMLHGTEKARFVGTVFGYIQAYKNSGGYDSHTRALVMARLLLRRLTAFSNSL